MLAVEISLDSTCLPRVLRLTMCLLLFVSVAEHRVVSYSVHLRSMLLPEIEGMRLQMIASACSTCSEALLRFVGLHGPDLVRSTQLLAHVVAVTVRHLARLFHVLLVHERLKSAYFA